ncbi:hypothetical protein C5167_040559 [Papaver somniferum]|uniref:RING-CH-type domain-containing protein n=1 Tax=Papaver somniferum TaxID=3469 RepID=A0A4Y7IFG6_PAPSO|nr:hypothetical protein C5167_040559 [Papaver somniferum]
MVDDFMVVCVDRIIASACFQSVNDGAGVVVERISKDDQVVKIDNKNYGEGCSKSNKSGDMMMIECRICQEEDEEHQMEAPCACNGTLKVYSPNYTLPPPITNPDGLAIDIRQAWGQRIDLRDPHFLALAAEHQLLHPDYDDYGMANTSGVTCFRSIALFLMLVLLVRHGLIIATDSGLMQESSALFHVSLLQFAGFLLPCYVMARSWYTMQCRRRRQG